MAYDGLWIRSQVNYYQKNLINDRIYKITQNNIKEYDFHIHKNKDDFILTLCCNPTFPYILYSNEKKDNFDTPKAFLMLLRKYLQGGEILDIKQINGKNNNNSLERIVDFTIKNLSDIGDIKIYHVIIELMGKYSNIILCDDKYMIIDLVNKISDSSNNRPLLPNNKYETITISKKIEFLDISFNDFTKIIKDTYNKALLNNDNIDMPTIFCDAFLGFSKTYIYNRFIDKKYDINNEKDLKYIYDTVINDINSLFNEESKYYIYYKNNKIKDFHNIKYNNYDNFDAYDTPDKCLLMYINNKIKDTNESYDKTILKDKISNIIEKYTKKIDINKKDLSKCDDMEKYKLYGDLLSSFGYDNSLINNNILTCKNYYDNDNIINIPIDTTISIQNNIKKYYDKYNKLKRTFTKVNELYIDNNEKLEHILSIKDSLEICDNKTDILNIKDELKEYFSNNVKTTNKKNNTNIIKSRSHILLHHYKTTNGIDIYIGKNNIQNEYLSFTYADKNDTWFHIKNDTGSHVILKANYEKCDMKDIEETASLAAYFSSKKNEKKVEVDYTLVKELKKVKGKAPGFCIYHKNYSIVAEPRLLEEVMN